VLPSSLPILLAGSTVASFPNDSLDGLLPLHASRPRITRCRRSKTFRMNHLVGPLANLGSNVSTVALPLGEIDLS
jgi:hypothetical protein